MTNVVRRGCDRSEKGRVNAWALKYDEYAIMRKWKMKVRENLKGKD